MKPTTSDQYPLPIQRPHYLVTNKVKIKRAFGIEVPHWEDPLRAFLIGLSAAANHTGAT